MKRLLLLVTLLISFTTIALCQSYSYSVQQEEGVNVAITDNIIQFNNNTKGIMGYVWSDVESSINALSFVVNSGDSKFLNYINRLGQSENKTITPDASITFSDGATFYSPLASITYSTPEYLAINIFLSQLTDPAVSSGQSEEQRANWLTMHLMTYDITKVRVGEFSFSINLVKTQPTLGPMFAKEVLASTSGSDNLETSAEEAKNAEFLIENGIKTISLPMNYGEGMVMTDLRIVGSYLVYTIECNETVHDMNTYSQMVEELKQAILEAIVTDNDPDINTMVSLCIKAHKGICFKYVGENTRKECPVYIEYDDLKKAKAK